MVVTATSNGSTAQLRQGSTLIVRLPSNGTTGYSWAPAQIPEQLRLVKDEYGAPPQREGPPVAGEGGTQELRFLAHEAGSGTLILDYRPAWDRGPESDQTFQITTQVSGS